MNHHTTADFWACYHRLPEAVRRLADANYQLLKTDPVLKAHKVLIFTEFAETARYLRRQLEAAGIQGVEQIDSGTKGDRGEMLRRFAPYYNGSRSAELADDGLAETRVLISTDVLSEGLNLQDATRLINYDLHWNPVRLIQPGKQGADLLLNRLDLCHLLEKRQHPQF